jgi:hypothetical protein
MSTDQKTTTAPNPAAVPPRDTKAGMGIATGVSIGMSFGVAFGLLMKNLALGIGIGVAIGAGVGAALEETAKKKRRTDPEDDHG